jgi:uncharacterized protein YkwD
LAVLLAGSAGGATIVFGAPGPFDAPAQVSRPAVRLKVPTDTPPSPELATAYEMVALVNADRLGRNLPAFEWLDSLWVAANGHSTEMAATGILQHQGVNGSNAGQRITAAGFDWSAWGENLGAGYIDPGQLLVGWLNSPPHRTILLGNFRHIGLAVVLSSTGTPYWTMVVAS